jgi:hypothetical protein
MEQKLEGIREIRTPEVGRQREPRYINLKQSKGVPFYSLSVFRNCDCTFDTCRNTFHAEYTIFHLYWNCLESLWVFLEFLEFENGYWTNFYTGAFTAAPIPINNNLRHPLSSTVLEVPRFLFFFSHLQVGVECYMIFVLDENGFPQL